MVPGIVDRRHDRQVVLDRPGAIVTIVYPTEEDNTVTTFHIPEHSRWASLHPLSSDKDTDELYTEIFRVVRGRVKLVKDGVVGIISADDGEQHIPKYCIHEFMRADIDRETSDDGDVIVQEWVDPADGCKELFFRNIMGVLQDAKLYGRSMPVQILMTEHFFDNYDVYVPGRLSWIATHCIYATMTFLGRLWGMKPTYTEYTPTRLEHLIQAPVAVRTKQN